MAEPAELTALPARVNAATASLVLRQRAVLRRAGPLLLFASLASATTLVHLDVGALTRASTRVARARVDAISSRWAEPGRIVTEVQLTRLETWSGSDLPSLRVLLPGGEVDGIAQRLEGVPTFRPGEDLVLFLAARGPAQTSQAHQLVGLSEGVWRVERTEAGELLARPEPLDGIRLVEPRGSRSTEARVPLSLAALRSRVQAARAR
jgi:hypothetical protein